VFCTLESRRLTSPEISNLWTHYLNETMSKCVTKYMLEIVKDHDIHCVFEMALELSQKHIDTIKSLFKREDFPIPNGFTDKDVNLEAPPIFTDKFCLLYLYIMSVHGSQAYGLAFSVSIRKDVRDFYFQCNIDTMNTLNKAIEVLMSKDYLNIPPHYSTPKKVSYIEDFSYVTDIIGKPRTMNTIEGGNLFFNLQKSNIAKGCFLAFEQACKDKDVKELFGKCVSRANKHIGIFSNLLLKENLHSPCPLELEITTSTVSPFSDKLLLFHTDFLFAAAISYYGAASVAVMRADLALLCEKAIMSDLIFYASIGKLMIQKKWLEQPPESDDRTIV
jgi:hypothetical protein